MVGGEKSVDAQPGFDPQTNEPIVSFRFDRIGATKFEGLHSKMWANLLRLYLIIK